MVPPSVSPPQVYNRRQERLERLKQLHRQTDAAVVIQRYWRGHRARKAFDKALDAIVLIQRMARGFLARKHVQSYKAARKIQAHVRGFVQRRRFHRMVQHKRQTAAAVILQRCTRGFLARRRVGRIRRDLREGHASIQIQRVARGFLARQRVKKLRRDNRERAAAILIQRFGRGFLARRRVAKIRRDLRERAAAILIQRVARGFLVRRRMEKLRAELRAERRWAAAIRIQRHYRGSIVRRRQLPRLRRDEAATCVACMRTLTGAVYICGICGTAFHLACRNPVIRASLALNFFVPLHFSLSMQLLGYEYEDQLAFPYQPWSVSYVSYLHIVHLSLDVSLHPSFADPFTRERVCPPCGAAHTADAAPAPLYRELVIEMIATSRPGEIVRKHGTASGAETRDNGMNASASRPPVERAPSTLRSPSMAARPRGLIATASLRGSTLADLTQPGRVRVLRKIEPEPGVDPGAAAAAAALLQGGPEEGVETAFGRMGSNAAKRLHLARQYAYVCAKDAEGEGGLGAGPGPGGQSALQLQPLQRTVGGRGGRGDGG